MSRIKVFVSAFLAGVCIAIGGTVYLSLDNKVLGALFFTVGLFTICVFGLHLFTGKVCYVFQNNRDYALALPVIWLGNLVFTSLTAGCAALTRSAPALAEKAMTLCATKAGDSLLSLFFLGILCNIFIYIAVEGYKNNPHEVGKYLSLLFGITVFIL
jgi:formate/nitrite transporter FocA (FNT family)